MPPTRRRTTSTSRASAARTRRTDLRSSSIVRLAKVREVQKRIAAGFYDRDDVRERLARTVLEEINKG